MEPKGAEVSAQDNANPANPPPAYPARSPMPSPVSQQPPYSPIVQQQPYQGPALTTTQLGEQYRADLYARCAQGAHDPKVKFGLCGIITAVICFPIGLICLCLDTDRVCARCGVRL